jgi:hypothetical protein
MVSAVYPNESTTFSATKQAIRVMDLHTLNPIAPEPGLKNMEAGLYWSLT